MPTNLPHDSSSFEPGPIEVPSVQIPVFQRFQLERWAAQAYPLVACGVLYGHVGASGTASVVQARLAVEAAVAGSLDGGDPPDRTAAEREARELGLEVIGTWCSRPDLPAVPTPGDRARAAEGWSHVFVSIDLHAERDVRSWRFAGDHFVEEQLAT